MCSKSSAGSLSRKGLVAITLVVIGLCLAAALKGVRFSNTTVEVSGAAASEPTKADSIVVVEATVTASRADVLEANADRLMRLIRECLKSSPGSPSESECSPEWIELINTDVSAALDIWEEIEEPSLRDHWLAFVARHWARIDGDKALNWATQLSDVGSRDIAVRSALAGLGETKPREAVRFAERLLTGELREVMLQEIGRLWATQNLDEAVAWAQARPPDDNRDKLFLEMVLATAAANPEQAARIAVEHISPGVIQANAALSVVACWAQTDFPAATTWVNRFPEGQARDHAVLQLGRAAFYQAWRPALEFSPP